MSEIYKKIFEAKKEIGKIVKDSTNPFYNSKFFDINKLLEHVEPILEEKELLVLQPIIEGWVTTQIIEVSSGEMVTSSVKLSDDKNPQKLGSEITYYRRYTLQALLGLQAEDDDGNGASGKELTPEQKLKNCKTQEELRFAYMSLTTQQKESFKELKDKLKLELK